MCLNEVMPQEQEMDKELVKRLNQIEERKLKLQRDEITSRVHNAFPWAVLAGLLVLCAGVMIIASAFGQGSEHGRKTEPITQR